MANTELDLAWWKQRQDMKAFFKHQDEKWTTSSLAMKFYIAGAIVLALGVVSTFGTILFVSAKDFSQCMVTVGIVSIAFGVVIETYFFVMAALATTLGKVIAGFLLPLAIALANGMAQVVINSTTGFDPTHFPGTRAFVTPLMVMYFILFGSIALFFVSTCFLMTAAMFDMFKLWLAKRNSVEQKNQESKLIKHLIRFIAALCLFGLSLSGWKFIQKPYEHSLEVAVVRFTYYLEMYPDSECFESKTIHTKRINDQLVLTAELKNGIYLFQTRSCDIALQSGK